MLLILLAVLNFYFAKLLYSKLIFDEDKGSFIAYKEINIQKCNFVKSSDQVYKIQQFWIKKRIILQIFHACKLGYL